MNGTKDVFDRVGAFFGLLAAAPFLLCISACIAARMGRPVLYVSTRIGKDGKPFRMVKFRTMSVGADRHAAGSITVNGDDRVTPLGRLLRRYKLDELPELWNVLKGEMSLVGPRPDVPGYADRLAGSDREVLRLKPGITGPATLKYANEEHILAAAPDPKRFNDEVIFPDKVRINLEYMRNWSLVEDIRILWRTVFRGDY